MDVNLTSNVVVNKHINIDNYLTSEQSRGIVLTMDEKLDSSAASGTFRDEAADVLQRLRSGLSRVIAGIPDGVPRGADLHRALGIERTLGWRIFKVANAADPLSAGTLIPRRPHLNSFLRAAAKKGTPTGLVDAASLAADEFEKLIVKHAGDRSTFDTMVSALAAGDENERIDLAHRRSAFRANRHLWGVYSTVRLKTKIVDLSDDPSSVSIAGITGHYGLRQLRHDAPVVISDTGAFEDGGLPCNPVFEPLDPASDTGHGIALLRDFCSQPLPHIESTVSVGSKVLSVLKPNDVGNTAAITCLTGWVSHAGQVRFANGTDNIVNFGAQTYLPNEVLIHDVLVREGAFGPFPPTAWASVESGPVLGERSHSDPVRRVRFNVSLTHIGRGPSAVHTPEVPRYEEMLNYVFDQLDWEREKFDVYRCRIEYPVMQSLAVISFKLAAPPEE